MNAQLKCTKCGRGLILDFCYRAWLQRFRYEPMMKLLFLLKACAQPSKHKQKKYLTRWSGYSGQKKVALSYEIPHPARRDSVDPISELDLVIYFSYIDSGLMENIRIACGD